MEKANQSIKLGKYIKYIKDNLLWVSEKEKGPLFGIMATSMKDNGLMAKFMEKENIFAKTDHNTMVIGSKANCMAVE